MNYQDAKKAVFARGTIPDGYNGDRASVGFAFDPATGKTIVVADCGCFTHQVPQAVDIEESLWLLKNHPSANNTKITSTKHFHLF